MTEPAAIADCNASTTFSLGGGALAALEEENGFDAAPGLPLPLPLLGVALLLRFMAREARCAGVRSRCLHACCSACRRSHLSAHHSTISARMNQESRSAHIFRSSKLNMPSSHSARSSNPYLYCWWVRREEKEQVQTEEHEFVLEEKEKTEEKEEEEEEEEDQCNPLVQTMKEEEAMNSGGEDTASWWAPKWSGPHQVFDDQATVQHHEDDTAQVKQTAMSARKCRFWREQGRASGLMHGRMTLRRGTHFATLGNPPAAAAAAAAAVVAAATASSSGPERSLGLRASDGSCVHRVQSLPREAALDRLASTARLASHRRRLPSRCR